jgi:hypothetical protein
MVLEDSGTAALGCAFSLLSEWKMPETRLH